MTTIMRVARKHYFQRLKNLIAAIEQQQEAAMEKAAETIAGTITSGGCVHVYDTGHMLSQELYNRAGGMVAFQPINIQISVASEARHRPDKQTEPTEGIHAYALKRSRLHAGDVLIVGSVSGKSEAVVDLVQAAKARGATVIALTSLTYSAQLTSDHSSGLRLFEAADIVIDNMAPQMDAMLQLEGMETAICPASGISAAVIMWAIEAQVAERLLEKGIIPSVLKSVNAPGTEAHNEAAYSTYRDCGY